MSDDGNGNGNGNGHSGAAIKEHVANASCRCDDPQILRHGPERVCWYCFQRTYGADENTAAAAENGGIASVDPDRARKALEGIWGLPAAKVTITSARIIGHGREASCEVELSNGETMVFERMAELVSGTSLITEIAACAGVAVNLKQVDKLKSVAYVRALAERHAAETISTMAFEWGVEFLATCQQVEVDMTDQAERWECFEALRRSDPIATSREQQGTSAVRHMVVPVDRSGLRYVRAGWFIYAVRQYDGTAGAPQIIARMVRAGWIRRGSQGRIGARQPGFPRQTNLKFLLAPQGWENLSEEALDESITADNRLLTRAHTHAHKLLTTDGYQLPAQPSEDGS